MNRYCEEFGCGIPQAISDLENAPHLLVLEVFDLRSFLATHAADARATPGSKIDPPTGPMADRLAAAWATIAADRKQAHEEKLLKAGQ